MVDYPLQKALTAHVLLIAALYPSKTSIIVFCRKFYSGDLRHEHTVFAVVTASSPSQALRLLLGMAAGCRPADCLLEDVDRVCSNNVYRFVDRDATPHADCSSTNRASCPALRPGRSERARDRRNPQLGPLRASDAAIERPSGVQYYVFVLRFGCATTSYRVQSTVLLRMSQGHRIRYIASDRLHPVLLIARQLLRPCSCPDLHPPGTLVNSVPHKRHKPCHALLPVISPRAADRWIWRLHAQYLESCQS